MRLFRRRRPVLFKRADAIGSIEHYYHFLWGYLLPALDIALTRRLTGPILMRSCGPVLTPKLVEAARDVHLDLRIDDGPPPGDAEIITLPALDARIICAPRGPVDDPVHPFHDKLAALPRTRPDLHAALCDPAAIAALPADLRALRDRLLPPLLAAAREPAPAPFLVIRRADQPDYYDRDGPAESKGYGAGRRSLEGIDAAVEALRARGHAAQGYVCDAHSVADQAAAFAGARGIAMVRGAEAGNLIWCRPDTPVLILEPPGMVASPPHETMAAAARLRLTVLPAETRAPVLDPDAVAAAWGPHPATG
ncbi:glycosyltransferase 61 family protein [Histidinibacterium lentulum]|nr:glycosyltransferase 61 family protein [Histidinibacterium lentulum]